jgi:hypothetical protein
MWKCQWTQAEEDKVSVVQIQSQEERIKRLHKVLHEDVMRKA